MKIQNIIKPRVRLSFGSTTSLGNFSYGPGIAGLCRGVSEDGSLNRAAKEMNMAYSKAWRIIKNTEEAIGVELLDRQGAHGSTLTEEGLILLSTYDQLEQEINEFAEKRLKEILEGR